MSAVVPKGAAGFALFYHTCHCPAGVGEGVFVLHRSQQTVCHFGLWSRSLASLGTHQELQNI